MTDKIYLYRGASETRAFGLLPAGDYSFVITGVEPPYYKNGKWILAVKLTIQPPGIQPHGVLVFANPWSGTDKNGEDRDGIADLLIAVNRAPAVGQEPEWGRLIGAKGKCRLKIQPDQNNIDRNKVAFFHRPKQVEPAVAHSTSSEQAQRPPTYSPAEVNQAAKAAQAAAGGADVEPDDIPF